MTTCTKKNGGRIRKLEIKRYAKGKLEAFEDNLAEEGIVHVEMGEGAAYDALITPDEIKEFVYGNLYSEGFIKSVEDVEDYLERKTDRVIYVTVTIKDFHLIKNVMKRNYNIIWTGCGGGTEFKRIGDDFKPIEREIKIDAMAFLTINEKIKDKIELFRLTGAFHYAFLFDRNMDIVNHSYDIGRHNAVDKVIGKNLLSGNNLTDNILFVTGRVSSDIVHKCLRARVPVIATRGAAFITAVRTARKYNMGLIGFLRGKRFNVYSNGDMIGFNDMKTE